MFFFFFKNRFTELKNRTAPNNLVNRISVFTCFGAVFGFGFLETENSVTELFNRTAFCTALMKGINPELMCHRLNIDPRVPTQRQKRRALNPERA